MLLEEQRASPLKDEEILQFSKLSTHSKIILERMIGNVVKCEVDAFIYVVLGDQEDVPYKETVCTTDCKRYRRAVALTEVLIIGFNCISIKH